MYKLAIIYDTSYFIKGGIFPVHGERFGLQFELCSEEWVFQDLQIDNIVTNHVLLELENHLKGELRKEAANARGVLVDKHGQYIETNIDHIEPGKVPNIVFGADSSVDKRLIGYGLELADNTKYDAVVILTNDGGIKRTVLSIGNSKLTAMGSTRELAENNSHIKTLMNDQIKASDKKQRVNKEIKALLVASAVAVIWFLVGIDGCAEEVLVKTSFLGGDTYAHVTMWGALIVWTVIVWLVVYFIMKHKE